MNPKRLVLDDVRTPNFDAVIVRTAQEALALIRSGEHFDEVWLDHDLDMAPVKSPDTTWMTAQLQADAELGQTYPVGMFVLHSANDRGRLKMRRHLDSFYTVIDMERYPDLELALTGGGVIEMYVDGRNRKYPVAMFSKAAI